MNYNTPYSDKFLHLNLNIYAKLIYPRLSYRMRMSLQKGDAYYYKKGGYFYIVYKADDLAEFFNLTPYKVRVGLHALDDAGLIKPHWAGHFYRYELPRFSEFDTSHLKSFNHLPQKFLGSHREIKEKTNKTNSNTVNTKPLQNKLKFKRASLTTCWRDSAKKLGLTLDTINLIAEFSSTYNQSAYKIAGYVKEARDITANKYHIKKLARRFESNDNIINHLAKKLKVLFTRITSKGDHTAKLSNYAGFLINSLKRFFKWAFGKGKDETVKPKTNNGHSNYRKRKPISEEMPQWWKDKQDNKAKPKKASSLLNKLNQANIALLNATDPDNHNASDGKITALRKRVNHYRKLWNNKQAKPKSRPKQPKETPTSPALQREIRKRLTQLGETPKKSKQCKAYDSKEDAIRHNGCYQPDVFKDRLGY